MGRRGHAARISCAARAQTALVSDDFDVDELLDVLELLELATEPPSLLLAPPESPAPLELLAPLELYRSAYQPPPLRMNPPPKEIWRLASALPQEGQSFRGSALIGC